MYIKNFRALASNAYADDKTVNVIKDIAPYLIDNENESITRGDCIKIIMEIIGVEPDIADWYANSCYDQPVFSDLEHDDINTGYIIISKFAGVSVGIQRDEHDTIRDFCPKRSITVKECLAFMLRCLKNPVTVVWENIIPQAVETGLLQAEEAHDLNPDQTLGGGTFRAFIERMLNMNRHLYWSTEEPSTGYEKSMQIDQSDSIRYVDRILKKQGKGYEN